MEIEDDTYYGAIQGGGGPEGAALAEYERARRACPIAFFIPHGMPWRENDVWREEAGVTYPKSEYPEAYKNDGVGLLNDWTHGIVMMVAPNQVGKSHLITVWTALHVIECEPSWQIFKKSGVACPKWTGPKHWVMASYSWDNVNTLWQHVQHVFPRDVLGKYAPQYGSMEGETGNGAQLTFGDGKPKLCRLTNGGSIKFLCYDQRQNHWEGFWCDGATLDEQCPELKLTGLDRGMTTRGDYTPIGMALTGHVLEDRPDTGATGWIKRELWDGRNDHGKSIGRYMMSIDSTPEAVISKAKRQEKWDQFVNPDVTRSPKMAQEAIARYWGGFEQSGGRLFDADCWDAAIHVIDRPWPDDKVPKTWTKWRVIDYADRGVTCVGWIAVGPEYAVCYRLIYEKNLLASETARKMIEMSHNKQEAVDVVEDDHVPGQFYTRYRESVNEADGGERIYQDLMDSRSGAQIKQGPTLIELFERYGLTNLAAACGKIDDVQLANLRDWLKIDWSRKHPLNKGKDGQPLMGAAKLYFIGSAVSRGIEEVETCPEEYSKDTPMHFIDVLKYWASDGPSYMGDKDVNTSQPTVERGYDEADRPNGLRKPHKFTGY
jgi:hypothetical protein